MSDAATRAAERIADDISEDNEREAWIAEASDIIHAEFPQHGPGTQDEINHLAAQVDELLSLMPCGHPRACIYDPVATGDFLKEPQVSHCTACERECKLVEVAMRMGNEEWIAGSTTFEDVKKEAGL